MSQQIFSKNALGDVKYLLSGNGSVLAKYTYDEWGKKISVTDENGNPVTDGTNIAHLNPFRYRSYYYDDETGLYYLNSRYYDPVTCRFVNADILITTDSNTIGINLYIYCGNNPVNRTDANGFFWKEIWGFCKKAVSSFAQSLHIEGGLGYGIGASRTLGSSGMSMSLYHDVVTLGIQHGEKFTSTSGSATAAVKLTNNLAIGIGDNYEHRYETGNTIYRDEHGTISSPLEIYECPNTKHNPTISIDKDQYVPSEINDGWFVGFSGDYHLILGGHYVIGIDVSNFIKLMAE